MELTDALRDIVSQGVLQAPNSRGTVTLVERDETVQFTKVILSGVPASTVVIRLDPNASHIAILRERMGLKRRCDYLLVAERYGEIKVMFIELKACLDNGWEEGKKQVCRSLPFYEYLYSASDVHFCKPSFKMRDVSRHYFVLSNRSSNGIDKQPVRVTDQRMRDPCHGVYVYGLVCYIVPFDKLVPP